MAKKSLLYSLTHFANKHKEGEKLHSQTNNKKREKKTRNKRKYYYDARLGQFGDHNIFWTAFNSQVCSNES